MRSEGVLIGDDHVIIDYRLDFKFPESESKVFDFASFNRAPLFLSKVKQMRLLTEKYVPDKRIKGCIDNVLSELESRKDV